MLVMANGWSLDFERGPNCLFVKLVPQTAGSGEEATVAEVVWSQLKQHFAHRLVLECDQVEHVDDDLASQLDLLQQRLATIGGVMRLCGLSAANLELLGQRSQEGSWPHYVDRDDAVMAGHLRQQR